MASKRSTGPAKALLAGFRTTQQPQRHCLIRTMATEASLQPQSIISEAFPTANLSSTPSPQDALTTPSSRPTYQTPPNPFLTTTTCTLHAFPSLEPTSFATYPSTHLSMPLRKDLLHRAVIYEADMTRQGTASTKYRSEVHGSNKKVRPQKGTGSARLGDKKSPTLRGGGVAFGPKPRDFSTELPRKVYDKAWRTALSYRYRRGEMVVIDGEAEISDIHPDSLERYTRDFLRWQNFGHAGGRTLFITAELRQNLFYALSRENMGREARALEVDLVDVKDLLELGRLVIERRALERLLREHETDLAPEQGLRASLRRIASGQVAGV